ncbi:MAG: isochorismatase family protein [Planctomycetia bacterium]|nr:isochorismatase family protein [Planctomycetia bacterium]
MRLESTSTLLAVVDIQERLLAAVPAGPRVVRGAMRLAAAARLLDVRIAATEQYPRGLGPTPAELAALLPGPSAKTAFSSCGCAPFATLVDASTPPIRAVVLCGLETHVCIAQTALDLLARGIWAFIAVDGVASRRDIDHDVALRRLESAGAVLTTTEAILFEWLRDSAHPHFKAVQKLVLD